MFKLNEELPTSVVINGEEYKVDMSFDNIITINEALNDDELSWEVQLYIGLKRLFVDLPDLPMKELEKVFVETYKGLVGIGEKKVKLDIKGNPMPSSPGEDGGKPSYDLVQDAEYIFASFFQYYGMDLHEHLGKLHYYKFRALLNGLGEDTIFQKIVHIRTCDLPSGKGSGKEKERMIELKKKYALK